MKRNLFLSFPKAARLLLAALICLPFWGTALMAQTAQPEAYAVFDSSNGTLTFKYDGNKPNDAYLMNTGTDFPGWSGNKEDIKKVVFDPSFAGARPTSCNGWFYNCRNLTDIEGISNLNTEEVTIMSAMFDGCKQLTSLDLSSFNTGEVTDMSGMISNCTSLESLNISSFNTEKVTDMSFMFDRCEKLASLDISSFDSKNVEYMSAMFQNCSSLASLDLSNFNTENVTVMISMFKGCQALATIYTSDKFVVTNVELDHNMFAECLKLKGAIEYDENKTNGSYANYTTGYFSLKTPTSINAINGNDKAEYFDINGKRGTKLQRGINLVRRGNKTYKVVVK